MCTVADDVNWTAMLARNKYDACLHSASLCFTLPSHTVLCSEWGVRLARRYYARLFKEYAIADLSRCTAAAGRDRKMGWGRGCVCMCEEMPAAPGLCHSSCS